MNPQDPYQPQQPYQPQPTPQTPPQQPQNGQYSVVPPIVANSSTNGHNPYEFIFNAQSQKKPASSMLKRIVLAVIGLAILAVIFAVVSSFLASGSNSGKQQLKTITQLQEELVGIAKDGTKNIRDQSLKNTATTLQLTTASSQAQLLAYSAKNGFEIDPKELGLLHDSATDKLLADAKSTSTYDTTWKQITRTQLDEYSASIKKLFDQTTKAELKKLLSTSYSNAQLISSQLKE
ncbi:MAG: hypothetical protein WAS36_04205 [Candidatus Saccharimonadales bacterium]